MLNSFHPLFLKEVVKRIGLKPYPNIKQFVVQHLYSDTYRLLDLLHEYVAVDVVISIGYSGDEEIVNSLKKRGIKVLNPSYKDLESTIIKELERSLNESVKNGSQLLIHEVGGYTVRLFHKYFKSFSNYVIGAVEVTKQGVWEAQKLPELLFPQMNCAETRLKLIEGKMVGDAVVSALDQILRGIGYSLTGRNACVLGYGWVGSGTALSLQKKGMTVVVNDKDVIKLVEATIDGFGTPYTVELFKNTHVVVGASGYCTINKEVIDVLPNRCFLVSGSSKDIEIDVTYLNTIKLKINKIHPFIDEYKLNDNRSLYLINKGYPVNFTGSSIPDEIVEFLLAELIILIKQIIEDDVPPAIHVLKPEYEKMPAQIWLEMR